MQNIAYLNKKKKTQKVLCIRSNILWSYTSTTISLWVFYSILTSTASKRQQALIALIFSTGCCTQSMQRQKMLNVRFSTKLALIDRTIFLMVSKLFQGIDFISSKNRQQALIALIFSTRCCTYVKYAATKNVNLFYFLESCLPQIQRYLKRFSREFKKMSLEAFKIRV